jgi:hypothetical protein
MKTPKPPGHALHPLLQMLTGSDRRSIGRSNEVVARVLKEPALLDLLFSGMLSHDPLLAMRCADAAEKVSARHPELLKPHKTLLLSSLSRAEQKELRWHVAPMLARLELSTAERRQVFDILLGYLDDPSSIVKALSMQAVADVAMPVKDLRELARLHIQKLMVTGTPAMKARAGSCWRNGVISCRSRQQCRRNFCAHVAQSATGG